MNQLWKTPGRRISAGALLLCLCNSLTCESGGQVESGGPYQATWESLSQVNEAPDWFLDAKFGIYFHWGVYSVPAFGSEWYPRNMYREGSAEYQHHLKTYGAHVDFPYTRFVPLFFAEKFDAGEWADLFARAGARFAGPVAEHHDGFAMWDSEVTPWNAKDRGPKRDITGELATAIRSKGMKLITTFHHARNNLWEFENRDGRWNGHYAHVKMSFPSLLENPDDAILYGYMPRPQFLGFWKAKLVEVIDKYQPDIMWFDSWLDEIPDSVKTEYLAHYFNSASRWGKEVVVTHKQEDLPQNVSILDLEKGRMGELTEFPWLTDDTISQGSWCYTEDLQIKPTSIVLHGLIDIVSKNGVLVLNISPKADGSIPQNQQRVLLEIGDWLAKNGEAIYDTRPWKTYGEGPTKLKPGHFGGVTDATGYTVQDVRYTTRGRTLYAIVLGRPTTDRVTLTSLQEGDFDIDKISMVGSKANIEWEWEPGGLSLLVPDEEIDNLAIVFKIES